VVILLLFKDGLLNLAVFKTVFIYIKCVVILLWFKDGLQNVAVFKTVFV